jgi:hypothetical protein
MASFYGRIYGRNTTGHTGAASEQAAMQETGSKELELTSLWMERTQWAHVYDGARRDLLVRITQVERKHWSRNGDFLRESTKAPNSSAAQPTS